MLNDEDINLPINKRFLKEMCSLSKTAIKIYLSLAFHRTKSIDTKHLGNKITVSHREIRINEFYPDRFNSNSFGVCSDERSYYKAIKELENKALIRITRTHTKNGKPLPNIYIFNDLHSGKKQW
ncbi:MAG: hypothetical protein AB7U51_12445 [Arcobacter sp.]|uniref:hypothetical protein n=1 Tax=Arcobacter sp. TaxID=1872629 RepID=UPI003CFEC552